MSKIEISVVRNFELAWNDSGSGASKDGSFYNPVEIPVGFSSMGSYGQGNYDAPNGAVLVVKEVEGGTLAHPTDYVQVYADHGTGSHKDGSFWLPVAPQGYTAMGILCVAGYDKPKDSEVVCLRDDLVVPATIGTEIWDDHRSGGRQDGSFWNMGPEAGTIHTGLFAGASNYNAADAVPYLAIAIDAV